MITQRPATIVDAAAITDSHHRSWNDGFAHLPGRRTLSDAEIDHWRRIRP